MPAPKKGLGSKGRGLEALIHTQIHDMNEKTDEKNGVAMINIDLIEPNREQPREKFEEQPLLELAQSIREYGVIQPIVVKKTNGSYKLIAGERRWRAAKIAGLTEIPAVLRDSDTITAFEIALVENIQRENLNPLEEARSYQRLIDEFQLNQEKIAEKVGKSRSAIANTLRLLHLDERVQNFVIENKITNGHARALLSIADKDMQFELAERIIDEELSVRDTEALVKKELEPQPSHSTPRKLENTRTFNTSNYKTLEHSLIDILGTKVKLSANKNKGKIEIEYYSDDDLDRLLCLMKGIQS